MSTVPGLHVLGEANFSDHGANRLGASALMQGLADGYFVIPYTISDYLASTPLPKVTTDHEAFKEAASCAQSQINRLLSIKGSRGIRETHRELGRIMWDDVGMARNEESLRRALEAIPKLREEFWQNVSVPGTPNNLNQSLEYAGARRRLSRVRGAARVRRAATPRIVRRPLPRREPDAGRRGAARRQELLVRRPRGSSPASAASRLLHKEKLEFEEVHPTQRSYK